MCLPATLAAPLLLASTVGSTAVGYIGQKKAADAQNAFQDSRYAATAESALRSYESQLRIGHKRVVQEELRSNQQSVENARSGDKAVGKARVSSAAGGVSGATAQELVSEFRMIEAENENALQTNMAWMRDQMGEQFAGLQAGTLSRINSATPQHVAGPSPLAAALKIGGAFLSNQVSANNKLAPGEKPLNTLEAFMGLF